MDDMKIASLHTATKSAYDRGQDLALLAASLQFEVLNGSYKGQVVEGVEVSAEAQAQIFMSQGRELLRESIGIMSDVQAHENAYPTKAIFYFRLWRIHDAIGYAYCAKSNCAMVLKDEAISLLLLKQSEDSHKVAAEYEARARQAEQDLLQGNQVKPGGKSAGKPDAKK